MWVAETATTGYIYPNYSSMIQSRIDAAYCIQKSTLPVTEKDKLVREILEQVKQLFQKEMEPFVIIDKQQLKDVSI